MTETRKTKEKPNFKTKNKRKRAYKSNFKKQNQNPEKAKRPKVQEEQQETSRNLASRQRQSRSRSRRSDAEAAQPVCLERSGGGARRRQARPPSRGWNKASEHEGEVGERKGIGKMETRLETISRWKRDKSKIRSDRILDNEKREIYLRYGEVRQVWTAIDTHLNCPIFFFFFVFIQMLNFKWNLR